MGGFSVGRGGAVSQLFPKRLSVGAEPGRRSGKLCSAKRHRWRLARGVQVHPGSMEGSCMRQRLFGPFSVAAAVRVTSRAADPHRILTGRVVTDRPHPLREVPSIRVAAP